MIRRFIKSSLAARQSRLFAAVSACSAALLLPGVPAACGEENARSVPAGVRQLVVAVAPGWKSQRAQLRCYERKNARSNWTPVVFSKPIPVLLGKGGIAWGRGVLSSEDSRAVIKREGDRKAPAGCFRIGRVFGYATALPSKSDYPYRQVTKWDAWVDDVKNPHYNRHVVVDPKSVPAWFEKQKMRHGDAAYKWLLEIRHNADPPVPGHGSAIFFHIRRGPNRTTAGCTTMKETDLVRILKWLRAEANPHYVLLPAAEYKQRAKTWNLPPVFP